MNLLAAGIDVYSTVNVQHLETLNDVVSGIAGIRVWETVPDRSSTKPTKWCWSIYRPTTCCSA
jgi:K+-sensing histidine kinase KdpD